MNVLCVNRKGGTGKTTVCDELLFSLERSNEAFADEDKLKIAFIDLDEQDSALHEDTSEQADSADVVVIDTPGALTSNVTEWMQNADVIVIPTGVNDRDLAMFLTTLEAAREHGDGAKVVIVVNRFNRYRASTDFMHALEELKQQGEIIVTLPQSELFNTAAALKKSVIDIGPKTAAALRVLKTVNAIREAAGLPPDAADVGALEQYLEERAKRVQEKRS